MFHRAASGSSRQGCEGHQCRTESAAPEAPRCKLRTDSFVQEVYWLGSEQEHKLGEGAFSEVVWARHKATGADVACKKMLLPPHGDSTYQLFTQEVFKEIDILCSLQHENLLSLIEYFVQGNQIYLFTELVRGGDLMKVLADREHLAEDEARLIFVQLLRGIDHMHQRNIAHRDLKLENILLNSEVPNDFSNIKIADFGLAKHIDNRGYLTTVCGSPQYVAPEVVQPHQAIGCSAYGPKVDMWGAGVVLYLLLAGYPPFDGDTHAELFALVRSGTFSFDLPVWDEVSNAAKDLICRLLVVDPAQRLTAAAALQHPWLQGLQQQQQQQHSGSHHHQQQQPCPGAWGSKVKKAIRNPISKLTASFRRGPEAMEH
mmetsp:Transcript_649/g.1955  ORF Transcript_649/g.1955 Transcript_649/m.1955 type:complete len:372 (+) Transcript_649:123-1238(+)